MNLHRVRPKTPHPTLAKKPNGSHQTRTHTRTNTTRRLQYTHWQINSRLRPLEVPTREGPLSLTFVATQITITYANNTTLADTADGNTGLDGVQATRTRSRHCLGRGGRWTCQGLRCRLHGTYQSTNESYRYE